MIDLSKTVEPKSTQTNADDFLAGPRTVTITSVSASTETEGQPIAISYAGDQGKPFFPCKSMRRVLINIWGSDGAKYVGKSLTLFRDPTVKFGGMDVGGIRISHASHIDKPVTMALTATRAQRKPFTVKPLVIEVQTDELDETEIKQAASSAARKGKEALQAHWKTIDKQSRAIVQTIMEDLKALAVEADTLPDDADYDAGNITDDPFEGEK